MTDKRRRCRLAVVASHPIQYFTPVYRRLAARADLDVEVFFCRDFGVRARYDKQFGRLVRWDVDQLEGYRHRFLANLSPIRDTFNPLHAVNPGVFVHILRGFDAVWMSGYTYPSNWLAAFSAALRGTRILFRSELRLDARRRVRVWDPLRDRIIRTWIRHSDALLYIGEENRRAYLAYGAPEEKLFFAPYSVDVARFLQGSERAAARARLRGQLGIPSDAIVLLFVGKLTPRKHPEAMLRLVGRGCAEHVHVVIAGSGPLERELRAEARRRSITNVTFLGFVNQSALPEVYAAGDIFVMPSEGETWGLVLNEAMGAGLAPVVARDVGAVADLVREGETGLTFPTNDWDAMERQVRRLVGDTALRLAMSAAARARSAKYSYEATADGIVGALAALGLTPGATGGTTTLTEAART